MRRAFGVALLILLASITPAAVAQTLCTAGSVTNLVLGPYTGASSTTGSQPLKITCNPGVAYSISIDKGNGVGATTTLRKMTLNGVTLNYQLFQTSALSPNWGNTVGTDVLNGTGSGVSQSLSMYPLIPAGQYAPPGTYTDTAVNASVKYGTSTYALPFTVTATVTTTCSISATSLVFGIYTGAQKDTTATLSVTCTNTTPYYVNLGNGLQPDGGWWPRMLGPNANLLNYIMYQDGAHNKVWRNTPNLDGESWTGTGTVKLLTIYGSIASGQNVLPGSYTDSVVATVTY